MIIPPPKETQMTDNNSNGGRKFFRIPIDETSKISITIADTSYEIVNIAAGGVGIYLDNINTFVTGDNVTDIVLTIDTVSCKVKGCVAHISAEDVGCLCGIELIEMDHQTKELLKRFMDDHRASLFSFMPDF